MNTFDTVPRDVFYLILSYLNIKDICTLSQVNKKIKRLADSETLWKELFFKYFDREKRADFSYKEAFLHQPFVTKYIKHKTQKNHYSKPKNLYALEYLAHSFIFFTKNHIIVQKHPSRERIVIDSVVLYENKETIPVNFHYLPHTKKISPNLLLCRDALLTLVIDTYQGVCVFASRISPKKIAYNKEHVFFLRGASIEVWDKKNFCLKETIPLQVFIEGMEASENFLYILSPDSVYKVDLKTLQVSLFKKGKIERLYTVDQNVILQSDKFSYLLDESGAYKKTFFPTMSFISSPIQEPVIRSSALICLSNPSGRYSVYKNFLYSFSLDLIYIFNLSIQVEHLIPLNHLSVKDELESLREVGIHNDILCLKGILKKGVNGKKNVIVFVDFNQKKIVCFNFFSPNDYNFKFDDGYFIYETYKAMILIEPIQKDKLTKKVKKTIKTIFHSPRS